MGEKMENAVTYTRYTTDAGITFYVPSNHPRWSIRLDGGTWFLFRDGNLVQHRDTLKATKQLLADGFANGCYTDPTD
jgi:hypothetical protein